MGGFPEESKEAKYILILAEPGFGVVGMRPRVTFPGHFIGKADAIRIIEEREMSMEDISPEWTEKGVERLWVLRSAPKSYPLNERATEIPSSSLAVRGDAIIFARSEIGDLE